MNKKLFGKYRLIIGINVALFLLAFIFNTPVEVTEGFIKILTSESILISDYIAIGGIGGALVNASLLCMVFVLILIKLDLKPNGSTIVALMIILGFGFFGKNLLNVWPVFFGCMLYSYYQKQPFRNYILVAIFGTSLSPVVNQILLVSAEKGLFAIVEAVLIGLLVGFLMPPVTTYCMRLHEGFSLANAGFASGLIATIFVSIFRAFNINFEIKRLWATGYNMELAIVLYFIFLVILVAGLFESKENSRTLFDLWKEPGKLVTDFTMLYGMRNTYFNMGIMGMIYTTLILSLGADINGATIAGILTIVGFSAFGKHPMNALPVSIGALIGSLLNIWPVTSPQMILSILFSTTLAPFTGTFGIPCGVLAGFLHTCVSMNISHISGGINLYSNGFAGGLVAIVLLPIVTSLRKES